MVCAIHSRTYATITFSPHSGAAFLLTHFRGDAKSAPALLFYSFCRRAFIILNDIKFVFKPILRNNRVSSSLFAHTLKK